VPESLSGELKADAAGFIDALPASVVMPAGAGKTHLLAASAKHVVDGGGKVLVITHTNAGVHAVAARLKRFGVTTAVQVTTITSLAFRLARAYPVLGERIVPRVMVPDDSQVYVRAATRVLEGAHIQAVLRASYTHVLVDEYQDCNTEHHAMVLKIKEAVSDVGVFGDPLQAIFGFSEELPDWHEVLREFPEHSGITPEPRRWAGHNEALGAWLFDVRPHLVAGKVLQLDNSKYPPGVRFTDISGNYQGVSNAARAALSHPADESVLVICARHAASGRSIAGQLDGLYTVMEEVAGSFIGGWLTKLLNAEPVGYASWLFDFTKKCHAKSGILDPDPLGKCYGRGETGGRLLGTSAKREPVRIAIEALDRVVAKPTLGELAAAMDVIPNSPGIRLHSHEAWYDAKTAIRGAAAQGGDKSLLHTELAKVRDSLRHAGRRERRRIISRTLLVKGLDYDHVIIADAGNHTEVNDLYVALTRARKSVHILASGGSLTLIESPRGPHAFEKSEGRENKHTAD
jgi:AAA domain